MDAMVSAAYSLAITRTLIDAGARQLFSANSAIPPAKGVVQLNVVLNRYLSVVFVPIPLVQFETVFMVDFWTNHSGIFLSSIGTLDAAGRLAGHHLLTNDPIV
jgi:hypothetical protein